mgnify:CR=1 FL=1
MKIEIADAIAEKLHYVLSPHCLCCAVVGSVRRRKAEVKDIEFVLIPNPYQTGIFEDGLAKIVNQWAKVKGEMEYGKIKYTQRVVDGGTKLDLFFATPDNFGYIFMLRTGSSEWNQRVMLPRLKGNGYKAHEGSIWWKGSILPVPEESDMFRIMGMDFVSPENRI